MPIKLFSRFICYIFYVVNWGMCFLRVVNFYFSKVGHKKRGWLLQQDINAFKSRNLRFEALQPNYRVDGMYVIWWRIVMKVWKKLIKIFFIKSEIDWDVNKMKVKKKEFCNITKLKNAMCPIKLRRTKAELCKTTGEGVDPRGWATIVISSEINGTWKSYHLFT